MPGSEIKTYSLFADQLSDYKEINELVKINLENGTMFYRSQKQFPVAMNIVTGESLETDINRLKLNLFAHAMGANSSMFISGADAQYLGLKLKDSNPVEYAERKKKNPGFSCRPVTIQHNTKERLYDKDMNNKMDVLSEGLCIDRQCYYLLDQFTNESVQRLYDSERLEKHLPHYSSEEKEKAHKIAARMVLNSYRYNNGLKQTRTQDGTYIVETPEMRDQRLKYSKINHTLNSDKQSPEYAEYKKNEKMKFDKYIPEMKNIFQSFRHQTVIQSLGSNNQFNISNQDTERLDESFRSLLEKIEKNPAITGTIARAAFDGFTEGYRSIHYKYSLDPIYSREEAKAREQNLSGRPKAMQPKVQRAIISDEKTREKFRKKSFAMGTGEGIGF